MNRSPFAAVLVTNQAGRRARLLPGVGDPARCTRSLEATLAAGGARFDGIYYCPHHPSVGEPPYRQDCDCRKPRPGLLHRAAAELGLDLAPLLRDRRPPGRPAARLERRRAGRVLVKSGYGLGELAWHAPSLAAPAGHRGRGPAGGGGARAGGGGSSGGAGMKRHAPAPSGDRLAELVASLRGRRVLVLADLVADEFLYGRIERVSREAPVLILQYDGTDLRLGGGANAAHNLLHARRAAHPAGRRRAGRRRPSAAPAPAGVRRVRARCRGRPRVRHAGEDAHPGGRRALHEATGRAHRQGDASRREERVAPARGGGDCAPSAGPSTACW